MALNNKEKIRGLIMGAAFTIQYWCFTKNRKKQQRPYVADDGDDGDNGC